MKKSKSISKRNPVAKNLKVNKPKVIPNKKKDAFAKAKKPKGGQMNAPYDGM